MTDTLTPKQEAFALAYVETGNAAEAYRRAYDVKAGTKPNSIYVSACRLLALRKVKVRIAFLQSGAAKHAVKKSAPNVQAKILASIEALAEGDLDDRLAEFCSWLAAYRPSRKVIGGSTRYRVFERAGFKCQSCGAKPARENDVTLHVDHIIPISLGGADDFCNLQCLCADCNLSKGNRHTYNHNLGWDNGS